MFRYQAVPFVDNVYQLLLDGQDTIPCSLAVCLLPCDDDHLRVAVLSGQVDFCVRFFPNLESKIKLLVRKNRPGLIRQLHLTSTVL